MNSFDNNFGCMTGILTALAGLAIWFVLVLVLSLPVMWLWNWLMPDLFNLPELSWIQAWGLSLLSGLLFKGTNVSMKSSK